jgi:hypothetical protein
VRLVGELEELAIAVVRIDHDQLVDLASLEERRDLLQLRDGAEELVVDPAARRTERALQVDRVVALADEDGAAAHAGDSHHVARQRLVAGAEEPDQQRGRHHGGRRQQVGVEVMARAPREGERQQRDEDERRQDPADARTYLAARVEAGLPEDEERDQREERQPLLDRIPEHSPQGREMAVDELAEHERRVEAERDACEIQEGEHENAREPPGCRPKRTSREEERPRRADVPGRDRLRRHRIGV